MALVGGLDHVALETGLADIVARLNSLVRERLIAERDVDRRALMLGFPLQIRLLVGDALRFVRAVADAWKPRGSPWIRGVYLTSGAQSGHALDRLSRELRAKARAAPGATADSSRGSVATFSSASFARWCSARPAWSVEMPEGSAGADGSGRPVPSLLTLGIAAIVGAWTWSYLGNRDRELPLEQTLSAWSETYAALAVEPRLRSPDGLAAIVPALDQLAALAAAARAPDPPDLRFGTITPRRARRANRGGLRDRHSRPASCHAS